VRDDEKVLELFAENKNTDTAVFIHEIMSNEDLWGQDLTKIEGFETQVIDHLANIRSQGVKPAMQKLMEG
jgi:tagaturonate reductase